MIGVFLMFYQLINDDKILTLWLKLSSGYNRTRFVLKEEKHGATR